MTDYWPGPRSASQHWPLIGHSLTILASDWPRLASILYCPVSRVRGEYLGRSSLWVSYITFISHTGDLSSGTFCHIMAQIKCQTQKLNSIQGRLLGKGARAKKGTSWAFSAGQQKHFLCIMTPPVVDQCALSPPDTHPSSISVL